MTDVIHANMKHKNVFVHKVCKQNIFTVSIVIYFPKNFYLVGAIDKKIGSLLSSGIVDHLIGKYVDMKYWKLKSVKKEAKPLTLQQVEGAFLIWTTFCLISFIVLIFEITKINFHNKSLNFMFKRKR